MPTGKQRFMSEREEKLYYQEFVKGLIRLHDLHQKWLPERGIEDISSEEIYRVMKNTGKTWDEIQLLTYDEFQRLKERR